MELISLLIAFTIASLGFMNSCRKRSKAKKQVNSFPECSYSEWSHSDISCSSDSGVVNITITSRR